jgi:hypothetical protein
MRGHCCWYGLRSERRGKKKGEREGVRRGDERNGVEMGEKGKKRKTEKEKHSTVQYYQHGVPQ